MSHEEYGTPEYYRESWEQMLGALKGWSPERVATWISATGRETALADPNNAIYHQPPHFWAAEVLIPETLRPDLTAAGEIELRNRLAAVFGEEHQPRQDPDGEWSHFKPEIEAELKSFIEERSDLGSELESEQA
jgi:hypothetical protein